MSTTKEKDSLYWKTLKAFDLLDVKTSATLTVNIESGIGDNGSNISSRISFVIFDPRISQGRVRIDLDYPHVHLLNEKLTILFSQGTKTVFEKSLSTHIPRISSKNKKELFFQFILDQDQYYVKMTIVDPLATMTQGNFHLRGNQFRVIWDFLKNFKDNFISSMMWQIQYAKSFDEMNTSISSVLAKVNSIDESMFHLRNEIRTVISHPIVSSNNEIPIVSANDYEGETFINPSSEIQQEFLNLCNSSDCFSDLQLDGGENEKNLRKIEVETGIQGFMAGVLKWDIINLKLWMLKILMITDESDSDLFSPFDVFLDLSNIPNNEKESLKSDPGYYLVQYAMIRFIKECVMDALNNKKGYKVFLTKFSISFVPGTRLYDLGKEMFVLFMTYSIIIRDLIEKLKMSQIDSQKIDEYNRVYFIFKTLITPFIFSIDVENIVQFKNESISLFSSFLENEQLFVAFEKEYMEVTSGGKLNLNIDIFDSNFTKFISMIPKQDSFINISNIDSITKFMQKNNISLPIKPISNSKDIQNEIFPNISKPKEKSKKETKNEEIEQVVEEQLVTDEKMNLFKKIITNYVDPNFMGVVSNSCQNFSDLMNFFRTTTLDIPSELFKIVRVMEVHPNLKTTEEILKTAKLLNEDEIVTESRVLQGNQNENNNDSFDLEQIIDLSI